MRRRLTTVLTGCLLLGLIAPWAHAEIINGQYVPPELMGQVGTQYRLVFITSGVITGDSPDYAAYDAFINSQVAGTALEGAFYGWKAVVSTNDGLREAKDVVSDSGIDPLVDYAGVYNTVGLTNPAVSGKVAASGDAMLGAAVSLLNPPRYDQNGIDKGSVHVWTGSDSLGEARYFTGFGGASIPATLGSPSYIVNGDVEATSIGSGLSADGNWLDFAVVYRNQNLPEGGKLEYTAAIYGMSDVLTVPVPEPATCVMWLMLSAIGGVVFWRRRRNNG